MTGVNSVTIIGNVGTIGEILETVNGSSKWFNITVATTEIYISLNNKEKKSNTQWHNVILWNNMSKLHKMISKGDLIYVEGRLNYRKKEDDVIFTEIVAKNVRVLNKKNYNPKQNSTDDFTDITHITFENNHI